MKCSCGNISRFEVYRLELTRLVINSKLVSAKRRVAPNAIEHRRVVETGPPIVVRCITCVDSFGPPSKFNCSEEELSLMRPESREGHNVPGRIQPLDEIKVKVKF